MATPLTPSTSGFLGVRKLCQEERFALIGLACDAVVEPEGEADEEEDGADAHLGLNVKD